MEVRGVEVELEKSENVDVSGEEGLLSVVGRVLRSEGLIEWRERWRGRNWQVSTSFVVGLEVWKWAGR